MRVIVALLTTGVLTASCAAAQPAPTPSGGARVIEITMKEFGFTPTTLQLRAGEKVTLRFRNLGKAEHEFMAGRQPTPGKGYADDWIAKAATNVPDHTHPGEAHTGEGVRVSADWYASLNLLVPPEPGEYEFGCFVQGHYESGMKGKIVVTR